MQEPHPKASQPHFEPRPAIAVLALSLVVASAGWSAPAVTSFSPTNGLPGTQVTVHGSGYAAALRVQFHQTTADFQVISPTTLLTTVPVGAEVGPVVVSDGSASGSSGTKHFLPEPRLDDFSPTRGAPLSSVDIRGASFAAVQEVRFGDQPASFTVPAVTLIRATVPAGVTSAVPIRVTTATATVSSSGLFAILSPEPVIDEFQPTLGGPGAQVEIFGVNFTGLTSVQFGGVPAVFTWPSPGRIVATVPAAAVTGPIKVVAGGRTAQSAGPFTVSLAPVITYVDPTVGKAGQTQVTIEGLNFVNLLGVGFNGRSITTQPIPPSPGRLLVTVPAGATTGRISVTNTAGVGLSATDFVIPVGPLIESFEPLFGRPGDQVRIWGYNLSGTLRFNQTVAHYNPSTAVPESIIAWVPGGATTGPLSLTNQVGGSATTNVFSVIGDAPVLFAAEPDHAPRGTQVTLHGRNFFNPVSVRFNGVVDPTANATAPGTILATVPATATTGPLVVQTSTGSATNPAPFHLPPRITSIQPPEAPVGGTVTITGANLAHTTGVDFADRPATFTVVAADGSLRAEVPADAIPGTIRVVTPGGVILSIDPFNIPPNITSFTPLLGPVGTPVTIYGTSLQGPSAVRFANRGAVFEGKSSTEIRTAVPSPATSGRIQVVTPRGTATSTADFRVTTSTDLRLTSVGSAKILAPGEDVTFTYTVTNQGLSPATSVVLLERLPNMVEHISAEASHGSWETTPDGVAFRLEVLTNGHAVSFTTTARASFEGLGTNLATLTLAEPDQNVGNNTTRLGLAVIDLSSLDLQIDHAALPGSVVVRWPKSALPLVLQSVSELTLDPLWGAASGSPEIINGANYLTNAASGTSTYYRLHLDF